MEYIVLHKGRCSVGWNSSKVADQVSLLKTTLAVSHCGFTCYQKHSLWMVDGSLWTKATNVKKPGVR